MENKTIARTLRLLSQLMELHNENAFKIKSVANAAFKVDKLPYPLEGKSLEELDQIEGIGKSIAAKIDELLKSGTLTELEDLLNQTPEGVVEMLRIKGIGPKKVATIWHELGIENIGELYYACNENRLVKAKGFGAKTQDEIRRLIEFRMANNGKFLYAQVEPEAQYLMGQIKAMFPESLKTFTGGYRRYDEILSELCVLIGTRDCELGLQSLSETDILQHAALENGKIKGYTDNGVPVSITIVEKRNYYKELFLQTGDAEHVAAVSERFTDEIDQPVSEELVYKKAGLEWMPPELRNGTAFIDEASRNALPVLINYHDLKGTLHNHTNYSDGINTLKEMALYCKEQLNLEYLGVCDHSKSAFYANGLSAERVLQQHEEIDKLNKTFGEGFRIFKGIESDILNDGSLDYPDDILQRFDFIVASVHSNLKMDEEKATARLIKAIENPYTTMLGHPTGRLLLSRRGYPINYAKVIDACAANNVIIEINANPLRLDLDWRWCRYAVDKGVLLSINPDAHRVEGFADMQYGIYVARKAGLQIKNCFNALPLAEVKAAFENKKSKITI
ncbi:helix-hairpin-helix domain-containing protein [Mucilaginibacter koreensis]